jgi:hypothetical protein
MRFKEKKKGFYIIPSPKLRAEDKKSQYPKEAQPPNAEVIFQKRKKERKGGQVLIREDYTVLFDPLVHYKVKIP